MNTVTLLGRLTRDPELDDTRGGTSVCRLRLAVPRRKTDDRDPGAVFVTVVTFGGQARACADHLRRGRQVAVSGRLEQREWTAGDGQHHAVHEVVAEQVEFLGGPNGRGQAPNDQPATAVSAAA